MNKIVLIALLCWSSVINAQEIVRDSFVIAQEMTNKGFDKLSNGDNIEAEQLFLQAIKMDAKVREAYINLNTIYKQEKPEEAIHIMKLASEVFYDDDEIWYYLANAYYKRNQFEKAISAYDVAIKYSKQNGDGFDLVWSFYFNKANSLAKLNKHRESIEVYTKAIEFNVDNANIYFNRGMNYLMIGKKDLAEQDWRKGGELGMPNVEQYISKHLK